MQDKNKYLFLKFIDSFHFSAGCWCTLPDHGHDQEEERGAEGRGGQTEGGRGIP